jgi:hypothetical protein
MKRTIINIEVTMPMRWLVGGLILVGSVFANATGARSGIMIAIRYINMTSEGRCGNMVVQKLKVNDHKTVTDIICGCRKEKNSRKSDRVYRILLSFKSLQWHQPINP